tara:strand:- start:39 stop:1310 length:1272 start_codon:yes stop_codon:yes gene_type:complete
MFRYGGPIKEGIMNGMQDRPGYKLGSTVASKLPFLGNLYNRGIANLKKIPGFFKSKIGKEVIDVDNPNIVKDSLGNVISRTTQTKFVPNYLGRDPGVRAIGAAYKGITSPTAKGFGQKVAQFATSPTALITGATLTDALPGGDPLFGTRNIFGQKFDPVTGIKTEGLFGRDLPAKKQLEELNAQRQELKAKKKLKEKKQETIDPNKKIDREAEIEANRKRYYKILGIDDMKKDAAYDSLIDASKIIQQEGADLKGAIKSGNLQTQIIDAISKNLDKSAAIKRQIDAAIVKAEIDKDVNKDKNALDKLVKEKQLKVLDRQLKGGSLEEVLADLQSKQGIVPEGPELASLAIRKDIDIPRGHTFNTKDVNSFLKDNPTLNVIDFVNDQNLKLQQAGKGNLDPGNYVVGKNIVEVGEDGTVIDIII